MGGKFFDEVDKMEIKKSTAKAWAIVLVGVVFFVWVFAVAIPTLERKSNENTRAAKMNKQECEKMPYVLSKASDGKSIQFRACDNSTKPLEEERPKPPNAPKIVSQKRAATEDGKNFMTILGSKNPDPKNSNCLNVFAQGRNDREPRLIDSSHSMQWKDVFIVKHDDTIIYWCDNGEVGKKQLKSLVTPLKVIAPKKVSWHVTLPAVPHKVGATRKQQELVDLVWAISGGDEKIIATIEMESRWRTDQREIIAKKDESGKVYLSATGNGVGMNQVDRRHWHEGDPIPNEKGNYMDKNNEIFHWNYYLKDPSYQARIAVKMIRGGVVHYGSTVSDRAIPRFKWPKRDV